MSSRYPLDSYLYAGRFDTVGGESSGYGPNPSLESTFALAATPQGMSTSTNDPGKVISVAKQFIDMGVERMMIESEGITE